MHGKFRAGLMEEVDRLRFFRRYRDDCTSINMGDFIQVASEIYPPSLTLTQENEWPNKANVLDMVAEVKDGSIVTSVYCKTDHFPFGVISFPFLDSNMDTRVCYRVFYGQIIRFQRLTSFRSDFENRTKFLADILLARGYDMGTLRRQFCRAIEKYTSEFQKWALPLDLVQWFQQIVRPD